MSQGQEAFYRWRIRKFIDRNVFLVIFVVLEILVHIVVFVQRFELVLSSVLRHKVFDFVAAVFAEMVTVQVERF